MSGEPEVITHARFPEQLRQTKNVRSEVSYMRAVRQFGSELAGENNPILVRCCAMIAIPSLYIYNMSKMALRRRFKGTAL